jgi:hypothetical protein
MCLRKLAIGLRDFPSLCGGVRHCRKEQCRISLWASTTLKHRIAVTETSDMATISMAEYAPKKRGANVSISEIKVGPMAHVSITDLKDGVP